MLQETISAITDKEKTPLVDIDYEHGKVFDHLNLRKGSCRVAIIYGDNASGKSYIARLIETEYRKSEIPSRSVSVKNRTSGGIESSLIFGREGRQSTGATSLKVMNKALNSAEQDRYRSLLVLDEPNLGLSKRYSRALGIHLAQRIEEMEKLDIVIVSHDEQFIKTLLDNLTETPTTLGINTKLSLNDWLNDDEVACLEELYGLSDLATAKRKAINKREQECLPPEKMQW